MLFDSLFSINEQQKAKAWSDFFKELKKDMKEIYNKFGGNAEWTTFLTRFSNDLSRASNYAEFENLPKTNALKPLAFSYGDTRRNAFRRANME